MSPRTIRILALSYLAKTLLLGLLWALVPDLPQRAKVEARAAWAHLTRSGTP